MVLVQYPEVAGDEDALGDGDGRPLSINVLTIDWLDKREINHFYIEHFIKFDLK